jgi:predicted alpha/beta-hydrolase family hydrolase
VAATEAAQAEAVSVVLVEQPYRVAGRRSPPGPAQLDEAWIAVVETLRADELSKLQLIVGGRSLGARVACRTVDATGAVAVLCLAFPLEPPRRAGKPPQSRLSELEAVKLPTLVVQGERDPFGMPPQARNRSVVTIPGTHSLRSSSAVAAAVSAWLAGLRPQ